MGLLHKTKVSLSFFGDDLDPAEISTLLGAAPTFGILKGASWTTPSSNERVARTGSWRLQAPSAVPGNLTGQIAAIFAQLSRDVTVWRTLSAKFSGRLFCGLFLQEGNEGLRIEPAMLTAIAERGLFLDLDIYSADRDEIGQSADT